VREVSGLDDVLRLMRQGHKNRTTFATNMNEHSSRSHCMLSVTATGTHRVTGAVSRGKLHLVDLAGSERVGKSGAEGARLKEAQAINSSLSALGDVIQARAEKRGHVPYRNSTLTYLLSDSLGKDSKTLMFVNCSPVLSNSEETLCSLNFAARVRSVELGKAVKHVSGPGAGAAAGGAGSPAAVAGAAAQGRAGVPRATAGSAATPTPGTPASEEGEGEEVGADGDDAGSTDTGGVAGGTGGDQTPAAAPSGSATPKAGPSAAAAAALGSPARPPPPAKAPPAGARTAAAMAAAARRSAVTGRP
jgi:kinesin family protein C2/C3